MIENPKAVTARRIVLAFFMSCLLTHTDQICRVLVVGRPRDGGGRPEEREALSGSRDGTHCPQNAHNWAIRAVIMVIEEGRTSP